MGIFKKNGNWWIDYYVNGRRKRKKIGKSKRQAEIILAKIKSQIIEGKYLDIKKNEKIKFEEMANLFLENYSRINKKSWKRDYFIIKNLNIFFGGRYIYEITNLDIENYKKKRLIEGVSYSTINRELACLRTIFNKAVEWKILRNNPPKITLYKIDNQRVRYLTLEEINSLINISPEPLRSIIIIALNTGMRRGEILNLKWRDIDFKERIITIYDTKNKEKRYVPINDTTINTLLGIKTNSLSEYVFPGKDGKGHISEHYISHLFEKAVERAGIKDFRFHDLRHTFASYLVMNGVDLKTVQELLGHKTFNMTLRYSHLSPEHKKLAVEMLEDNYKISIDAKNRHYLDTKRKQQKLKCYVSLGKLNT
ncbi:MAG: site-specific integrase [candidate division WOR-3 bacterium]